MLEQLKPCKCGSTDIFVWHHVEHERTSMEKIQCGTCGCTVWGGDQDAIDDWNNGRYDDEPTN